MRTIRARWYHKGRLSKIRVIVVHDMEAPEGPLTAENVANYFRTTSRKASAHVNVDNNSAVRCVEDTDTAFAAPGANTDGLQLEIAGYARQTREQWLDTYSRAALHQAALVVAEWCRRWDIPPKRLTRAELKAGKRGITSHVDVSAVYRLSDHHDPGPNFPWDILLAEVKTLLGAETPAPADDQPTAPDWPGRLLRYDPRSGPVAGTDVRAWQRQMRQRGWSVIVDGVYGPNSRDIAVRFQREKHLTPDGVVGPATWRAAWEEPVT